MVRSSWVAWCVGGLRGGDAAGIAGFGLTGQLAGSATTVRARWSTTVAVTSPGSNGPIEGVNTEGKFLKRQMYGRAGFALLRQRILLS
ncbi:transposase [Polymorphospora lycopeni]|uniref:Transposase IS204/IS1001/IS1096/IS1165 DDE domain-containing protein n=1 Tax=Polymorphospora lycopeni TaxID=3140240 RepID=A0ABV5CMV2_9ACTN